jgi:phenylpyruvate tautomerase PptA (4-oxalocrotonate tautomerase family)
MPLVEIKVFEGELSQNESQELIRKITALGPDDIRATQSGKLAA